MSNLSEECKKYVSGVKKLTKESKAKKLSGYNVFTKEEGKKRIKMKFFKATKKFSDPKLQFKDLYKCLGLKTELVERLSEMPCSISLPHAEDFEISDILVQSLKDLDIHCQKDNELSRRNYIQCIFLEALRTAGSKMQLKTEVHREYEGPKLILKGKADFLVGSSIDTVHGVKKKDQVLFDDFIILVEAKQRLGGSSYEAQICQILAAAGASLKVRQATKESSEYPATPVFGVLTDAVTFQFFAIDDDLNVYSSGDHTNLHLKANTDYKNSDDLKMILSWTNFIVKSIMSVSPRCSRTDLTPESAKKSLKSLMTCFLNTMKT